MPTEEPNSPAPPPLQYERPSGVTRGAFRLLLLLTFINTILLAMSLMGPQTWQAVRGAYTAFKDRRAAAAATAQREQVQRAAVKAAVGFQFPDNYVAYTERPDEAMRITSQGLPFAPIREDGGRSESPPPGWQVPVIAHPLPALLQGRPLGTEGTLFVHERTAPNGTKLLVFVVLRATYNFQNQTTIMEKNTLEETRYRVSKRRRLQSVALTTSPTGELTPSRQYELELILPDSEPTEVAVTRRQRSRGDPAGPTMTTMKPINQLRMLGGAPDPADASHFTIQFELDGQPGVIDGWLRDDSLMLTPRQGRPVPSTAHPHWDLLPATQPAAKP
jgi:hypothetical protein